MGCTQGRPSSLNSPNPSLHKLKMANGYVPGGGGGGGGFGDHHTNNHQSRRPPVGQRRFGSGNGRVFRQESMINAVERHGSGRTSTDSNEGEEEKRRSNGSDNGRRSRPESEEKRPAVKEEHESSKGSGSSGSGSRRITEVGKVVDDEDQMVDGWPKWLTDNVPRDALDGLTPRSAETYDKIDKVGQGTYSNVYKARDKYTGKVVALKKVRFDTSEPESVKFMAREIRILRKLDHPNVVKLEGLATSRMHYSIYLVFDYMQSDLSTIISRPDERLTEPQVKSYMQQLLSGLQHCHERGILHRDIKGSNLLIDRKGMLKIADFGLANYYNPEKRRPLTSRVVTLWYRAPELLLGATEYGTGIDLWSVGCLMAEMFTGKPIMPGRTEVEQLHKIFKLCGTPSEDFWKRVKLPTTFRPPQTYKPKLKEFFKNFPSSSFGLLNTLLALDPAKRGSAASALHDRFFYTMPMACDLSGLPAINKLPEDEPITPVDTRRQRSSKMRHRSQSLVVHRQKEKEETQQEEDSDAYAAQEKSAETMSLSQGPGSSSTRSTSSSIIKQTITLTTSSSSSSSSSKKIEEKAISPPQHLSSPPYNPKISSRTEEYVQSIKINSNIVLKNRPPLPEARRSHHNNNNNSSNNNNNGNNYMFRQGNDQVSRSVSTREFRNLDRNKLLELHAVD